MIELKLLVMALLRFYWDTHRPSKIFQSGQTPYGYFVDKALIALALVDPSTTQFEIEEALCSLVMEGFCLEREVDGAHFLIEARPNVTKGIPETASIR